MENLTAGTPRFGKYLLLDRIGQGGMSEVFLAKTEGIEGFERKVALKRIFHSLSDHREFVQSFIHEAKIGGMLYHHNVVQTLDFGRCDGTYFIALEYIEGSHLGALLARCRERQTTLPPGVFLQIALQICEGLDYIHNAQVEGESIRLVHRDIKPSNMLITTQGVIKISDFGVAKAEQKLGGITQAGSVKGTIGYMSPEQARGGDIGPASDLFSLGAMFYEMATLRRLYGEGTELELLNRVRECAFQVPIEAAGAFIPGLERVLKRLLSFDPKVRYQSAGQAAEALRALPVVVADRPALIAFIRSLGLLEPRPRESGPRPSLSFQPPAQELNLPNPIEGVRSAPSFAAVRGDHAGSRAQSALVALLVVLLGIGGAVGSYWLADRYMKKEGRAPTAAMPLKPAAANGQAVTVHLQTLPPGAQVIVDGLLVATTPADVPAQPGQQILVRLDGYRDWVQTVDNDPAQTDQHWVVSLQNAP